MDLTQQQTDLAVFPIDHIGPPLDQYERPVDRPEVVQYAGCVACGNPIDYCPGHGLIGDPIMALVLERHSNGDHCACHPSTCPLSTAGEPS